jgi:hypothetical protein
MSKQLLNEAELFLIDRWGEACRLEKSMKSIREKYKELFQQVVETVTDEHPELDSSKLWLTQAWSEGQIGFGRKSWPHSKDGNTEVPPGLWLLNLKLDYLAMEDKDAPSAIIWVSKKTKIDIGAARISMKQQAEKLYSMEELKRLENTEDEVLIELPAPSKRELLDAFSNGDGEEFVKLIVNQFDQMASFVPVLDRVFSKSA